MKEYYEKFRIRPGTDISLCDIDAGFTDKHSKDKKAAATIAHNAAKLRDLQELLYAEHKRSLLICLQAMDAGGKDGVIRQVLSVMNPQGCKVHSFRKPSSEELDHDFLWRAYRNMPAIGDVAIFNRSHYEDVLVVRVHKLVPEKVLARRYEEINAIEKHLSENGTHILKFYLHIDKDEQLTRFRDRLDDPTKHWKISESDYKERAYWDKYMEAFEIMLSRCSTDWAPWFVIPANHKWFRNLAVSQIIVEYLEKLHMQFPPTPVDIKKIRKEYHKAVVKDKA